MNIIMWIANNSVYPRPTLHKLNTLLSVFKTLVCSAVRSHYF
jgi:hypothetical protein